MACKLFHVKVDEMRTPDRAGQGRVDWVLDVVFIRSAEHKLIQMRRDGSS